MLSASPLPPDRVSRDARSRALISFTGFALGIWASREAAGFPTAAWAGLAALCVAGALLAPRRWASALLLAGAFAAGAATWSARVHDRAPDSIAALLPAEPGEPPLLIEFEGTITASPETIRPRRSSLHEHLPDYIASKEAFRLRVAADTVITAQGPQPASGRAWIRCRLPFDADHSAGQRVRVQGLARPPRAAMNPGEADFRAEARVRGDRFYVSVPGPSLVGTIPHRSRIDAMIAAARSLADLPRRTARRIIDRAAGEGDAGAIVRGLLLGERETDAPGLANAFARIGIAHLLSVSGFHVALAAFIALLAIRATGDRGRLEPIIVACAIALYMLVVPARSPIMRAGIMVLALLISDALGRRHDRIALLAWVGVAVLVWRPTELFSIGFQLSFGLVGWLLVIAEPRRDAVRIDAFEDPASRPVLGALLAWQAEAARAAAACWSVSIPVVLYHTGLVSPFAIVATLITVPLVIVTMWLGFLTLVVGVVAPPLVAPLAWVLGLAAGACAGVVRWADSVPFATVHLPPVSLAWTVFATGVMIWIWRRGRVRHAATWSLASAALVWLAVESHVGQQLPSGIAARVTVFDVSDGTAAVIESGGDAVLWDCGSFDEAIGVRTIPDACRAIGAPRVETVILTHANIDHYVGLIDAAPKLGVRTVMTGESFARAAAGSPAVAEFMRRLPSLGIEHVVLTAGDTMPIGEATLRILHPPAGFVPRQENDASLVARLDTGNDTPTALLTGDIQPEAMALLMTSGVDLSADVIELPHHGSARPEAYEFVRRVDPSVVLQSTGPSRLDDPRWDATRQGRRWLVTARDGAIRADLMRDGTVRSGPAR